jgi:uncharacterized membrane protein
VVCRSDPFASWSQQQCQQGMTCLVWTVLVCLVVVVWVYVFTLPLDKNRGVVGRFVIRLLQDKSRSLAVAAATVGLGIVVVPIAVGWMSDAPYDQSNLEYAVVLLAVAQMVQVLSDGLDHSDKHSQPRISTEYNKSV